jgi:hypothetical protein
VAASNTRDRGVSGDAGATLLCKAAAPPQRRPVVACRNWWTARTCIALPALRGSTPRPTFYEGAHAVSLRRNFRKRRTYNCLVQFDGHCPGLRFQTKPVWGVNSATSVLPPTIPVLSKAIARSTYRAAVNQSRSIARCFFSSRAQLAASAMALSDCPAMNSCTTSG